MVLVLINQYQILIMNGVIFILMFKIQNKYVIIIWILYKLIWMELNCLMMIQNILVLLN